MRCKARRRVLGKNFLVYIGLGHGKKAVYPPGVAMEKQNSMAQDLLKDVVYKRIKDMIINGSLPMAGKLSETVLATRLSASKAPVRDALRRLQSEGLVQIKPKSGTFVFSLSDVDFKDLLDFRFYIESKAMSLSLKKNPKQLVQEISSILDNMDFCINNGSTVEYIRLDNLFHEALFNWCQNPYLTQAYGLISSRMATIRHYMGSNDEHMHRSYVQHVTIVAALRDNDLDTALESLKGHILPEFGAYWGLL
ncbi:GntR family transcriptional regulator [Rouxiella chamberiensis]|uniref:GntR family transcriptional regulator n=1 Tax=Rouxiella chamberiensis TaxID=1513468 RepID=A0ABY7HSA0_9GAMM|nr:GntR family transcriptional regulator [Rouxiella chamberiensis]WAT02050.1 GntR family transcriptional regulator [Rouxiella chamberiensis]